MATKRAYYGPEFATILLVPALYYFLRELTTLDGDSAAVYSAAVGAFIMAVATWWRTQAPNAVEGASSNVSTLRLLAAAVLLTALCFLVETIFSAISLQAIGMTLEIAGRTDLLPEARRVVNRTIVFPLGLLVIFALGFWSAWILPVKHPMRWLAGVVLAWYSLRLALYPLAQEYGKGEHNVEFPSVS